MTMGGSNFKLKGAQAPNFGQVPQILEIRFDDKVTPKFLLYPLLVNTNVGGQAPKIFV